MTPKGNTDETYDQIELKRGGGTDHIKVWDKDRVPISNVNQFRIRNEMIEGNNYYRITGVFYTNTRSGTYAHEYGHMIGYWEEDYTNERNANGVPEPTIEQFRGSIMHTVNGIPLEHNFERIFLFNPPVNEK